MSPGINNNILKPNKKQYKLKFIDYVLRLLKSI